MKLKKILSILGICTLAVFLLAACSTKTSVISLSDSEVLLTAQAANPLPTQLANQGLAVVKTKACQVDSFVSIQAKDSQGDLLAWSPAGNYLAYVTPTNEKWGWFIGNLVVYDVAAQKSIFTTQNQEVAGDLTWSPDGKLLAYVVLDAKQKTYTIYVVDVSSGATQDIFASISAKTDDWSSAKGISKWSDSDNLQVTSSCDIDCSRAYSYNVQNEQISAQGSDKRKAEDTSLKITNQNDSPDSKWHIEVDNKDDVWLSSASSKQASIIATGAAISEIKWSGDSGYVAVRNDDTVMIFQPVCTQ
jgi:protease II